MKDLTPELIVETMIFLGWNDHEDSRRELENTLRAFQELEDHKKMIKVDNITRDHIGMRIVAKWQADPKRGQKEGEMMEIDGTINDVTDSTPYSRHDHHHLVVDSKLYYLPWRLAVMLEEYQDVDA